MVRLSRFACAALLFGCAGVAIAQPPGRPGGPGGPDKKDAPRERKEAERKDGDRPPAEALERELERLRARIAEVEGQLKNSRGPGGGDRKEEPRREGQSGPRGPGSPGGPGFPFGRGGPGGPGFGPPGDVGPGMHLPLERMSAEQIKQLIGRLQQALEAKSRGDQPKKPEGAKGGEEVMKRLERIQKELEDIRRSLGK